MAYSEEDGYVLRRALEYQDEAQKKKAKLEKNIKEAGRRRTRDWLEQKRFALPIKVDCLH